MSHSKLSPGLIAGIITTLFFGIALYLRIVLPYDQVFLSDCIKFTGTDTYYHMRIVDNLVHNFPNLNTLDPYMLYPKGMPIDSSHRFFDYLMAGIIWIAGLGSPTQHTIDVVGAYFPAILGALTVIPVFFIGKALFNRWAGVIAAGLIAIYPGEFLGRSILGRTDHHSAEVLFITTTILFVILAIKAAQQKQLNFNHLKDRDWAVIAKPLIYSLLSGIFFGIYLLTWLGALLFIFIIFIYFIIQFVIDHMRGKTTDHLCFIGFITLFIALIMFIPFATKEVYLASLVIALLAIALSGIVSRLMAKQKLKPAYYPLALIGFGLAGIAIFYVVNPSLLSSILSSFDKINPSGTKLTVIEATPLLFPTGNFSFLAAWGNFTTGFFISFISLGILIYLVIRQVESDKILFIVWSLVILAVTLSMRRFAYYFAVNVALLTGYFSWLILQLAGFKKKMVATVEINENTKKKKKKSKREKKQQRQKSGSRPITKWVNMALGIIVIFFLSFFPNIDLAIKSPPIVHALYAPDDAWYESLSWMKDNTPDPLGNPDLYYELYEEPFQYPDTAYSIAAWWDYGYWITRVGHRIPNCNPGGGSRVGIAKLFLTQNATSANKKIDKLNAKYIIIDYATATGKFYAIATYAGRNDKDFHDSYYHPQENKFVQFFYPEYYRSLAVRLYNFDGSEVIPQSSTVISYQERVSLEGNPYKEITSSKSFSNYEEAESYILNQESDNYKIVSSNPFVSPVPLESLEHYKLIYSSDSSKMSPNVGMIPKVKIFEYTKPPAPTVETAGVKNITDTSTKLRGNLTELGTAAEVTVSFLWGTTEACNDGETAIKVLDKTKPFGFALAGLSPNTTYYYKAKAIGDGTTYGEAKSFTTVFRTPTTKTYGARNITATSAQLVGRLANLGSATEVTVSFLWGTTEACEGGETTTKVFNEKKNFGRFLYDLSPNTTYYCKTKVVSHDTVYGKIMSFTTTER